MVAHVTTGRLVAARISMADLDTFARCEMAAATVDVGIDPVGMRELVAYTTPDNLGSRRVMEKTGFRFERDIVHLHLPHVLYRLRR